MKNYTASSVKNWMHKTFGVNNMPNTYEVQTNCPKCGHKQFYFNIRKQIGWCHRAKCHYRPTLDDLILIKGFAPDEWGVTEPKAKERNPFDGVLPGKPIITRSGVDYNETLYPKAVEYLQNRGLTIYDMLRFNITCDGYRVYVPVYDKNELVNYVGRDITGTSRLKYKYATGAKTSLYLFGWEEAQNWPNITLVENTFVSIWLRNHINCTTNFGSWLSENQLRMLASGRRRTIALIWDEGAECRAESCCKRLHDRGRQAAYAKIEGQPDDYTLDQLIEISAMTHQAAKEGRMFYE